MRFYFSLTSYISTMKILEGFWILKVKPGQSFFKTWIRRNAATLILPLRTSIFRIDWIHRTVHNAVT